MSSEINRINEKSLSGCIIYSMIIYNVYNLKWAIEVKKKYNQNKRKEKIYDLCEEIIDSRDIVTRANIWRLK